MTRTRPVRVLVVDDSPLVRRVLVAGLANDPDIEVVGEASDPYAARDLLVNLEPDVMTLDIEMPKMDGVTFLRKLMEVIPTPTIILSSLAGDGERLTHEALAAGAVAVVKKPTTRIVHGLPLALDDLCARVKAAANTSVHRPKGTNTEALQGPAGALGASDATTDRIIAIGASTGGVEALGRILPSFPPDSPAIVVVQHMPAGYTRAFAKRLDTLCRVRVREAVDGDRLLPGLCLVAPGGEHHLIVVGSSGEYRARLVHGAPIHFSRPSVDALFLSLAREAGRNVAAGILTGMGRDGAAGLKAIREAGGFTVAQDEATCVVFGMPGAAVQVGAATSVLPLVDIPNALVIGARRSR